MFTVLGLTLERCRENGCNSWQTVSDYFCKEFGNLSDAKACFEEVKADLEGDFCVEGHTSTCGFYGLRDRGNAVELWDDDNEEVIEFSQFTYDDWNEEV